MKVFSLGNPIEYNRYKVYYLIFIILLLSFIAWAWIGHPLKREMIEFYAWLGLLSFFIILFDNATQKEFEEIDTVTIETDKGIKLILLAGFIITIVAIYRILITNSAWVSYPVFQFFESKIANSILSGVAGIIENWFFFGVILPTIYINLNKHVFYGSSITTSIVSVFLVSLIFLIYHVFVYGNNMFALISSFTFALVCAVSVIITKSLIIADMLHFSNNVVASYLLLKIAFIIL